MRDDDDYLVTTHYNCEYTLRCDVIYVCNSEMKAKEKAKHFDDLVKKLSKKWFSLVNDATKEFLEDFKEGDSVKKNLIYNAAESLGDYIIFQ